MFRCSGMGHVWEAEIEDIPCATDKCQCGEKSLRDIGEEPEFKYHCVDCNIIVDWEHVDEHRGKVMH